jgi:chromosome partitioning protein
MRARVIAFCNQKGGVGKTTTTASLGVCLADMGYQVLLVDLDPQANLSLGLGIDVYTLERSVYNVLQHPEDGLADVIRRLDFPPPSPPHFLPPLTLGGDRGGSVSTPPNTSLDILPSTLDLTAAELELAGKYGREWLLKEALDPVRDPYDFILIDAPPSLGLFTLNALTAATEVIIPVQVHVYALRGLTQLQQSIRLVQKHNSALRIGGVVCTMSDSRNNLSRVVEESVRQAFGDLVFRTVIPMNVKLAEAPASGEPITRYSPSSIGAQAYRDLAREVIERG